MTENTSLSGMKAIREYCLSIGLPSSEATVFQMIKEYGFPARKLGGVWESNKESISQWRKRYVEIGTSTEKDKKISQKNKNSRKRESIM